MGRGVYEWTSYEILRYAQNDISENIGESFFHLFEIVQAGEEDK